MEQARVLMEQKSNLKLLLSVYERWATDLFPTSVADTLAKIEDLGSKKGVKA
jgi:hypothetical protein